VIVEKKRLGADTLLTVEGVIKLGESAEFFARTLERVLAEDGRNVYIDMARINYIDSTGIGELVGYLGRFREAKRKLVLVHPADRIRRLLHVAQLEDLFPIFDSLESAMEAEQVAPPPD
jgi:anti-sigma B factor antagonist